MRQQFFNENLHLFHIHRLYFYSIQHQKEFIIDFFLQFLDNVQQRNELVFTHWFLIKNNLNFFQQTVENSDQVGFSETLLDISFVFFRNFLPALEGKCLIFFFYELDRIWKKFLFDVPRSCFLADHLIDLVLKFFSWGHFLRKVSHHKAILQLNNPFLSEKLQFSDKNMHMRVDLAWGRRDYFLNWIVILSLFLLINFPVNNNFADDVHHNQEHVTNVLLG